LRGLFRYFRCSLIQCLPLLLEEESLSELLMSEEDEPLGRFDEEDDPKPLDPLVRPEESPRPSDCPIFLPNCELSL